MELIPEEWSPPFSKSPNPLSTLHRRFACARLSQPCLPGSGPGVSATLPSRPGEFHPEPLTDPDLTLSRHPARATERRLPPPVENWSSSCCQLAHRHYPLPSLVRSSPPRPTASVLSASPLICCTTMSGSASVGGDKPLDELSEEAFDRVCAINLRGTIMACKHVLPIMRLQRSGAIINISSVAARENSYPLVTYKATKAAMIAFTEQLALQNAPYGIRANCILPGLMDTPMAVDTRARASNRSRAAVAAERDAKVPLRGRMGTAWDVANAALFLASDEANFITGVALPVDGGALVRVG